MFKQFYSLYKFLFLPKTNQIKAEKLFGKNQISELCKN